MGIASSVLPRSRGTSSLDAIKPKYCVGDTKTRCQTHNCPRTKMARYIERSAWIRGGTVLGGTGTNEMRYATSHWRGWGGCNLGNSSGRVEGWKVEGWLLLLLGDPFSPLTALSPLSGFVPGISSPPLICGELRNRPV